ncbi:hypothetical protein BJF85_23745 [Saccharomonospora sp. CUA-673]|nr:hypothetical protein BJF85_23745 [Saccharomonospora sp. CUA-673]
MPGDRVSESGDVTTRLVAALRLRRPKVQWTIASALIVFMLVCVAATITRASVWPLLPLGSFVLAAVAAWRARVASDDRHVVGWTSAAAGGIAFGFWLLGMINRLW